MAVKSGLILSADEFWFTGYYFCVTVYKAGAAVANAKAGYPGC
jgi:hypothetical protein